jgi:hypothetical protein
MYHKQKSSRDSNASSKEKKMTTQLSICHKHNNFPAKFPTNLTNHILWYHTRHQHKPSSLIKYFSFMGVLVCQMIVVRLLCAADITEEQ